MQRRLALFMKLLFGSFLALLSFINIMYSAYPETRPEQATATNIFSAAGMMILGVAWYVTSRETRRGDNSLVALEVTCVVATSMAFTTSCILSADRPANIYSSFIWMSFVVFARVLVVPSSAPRTAVLSAVGIIPLLGVSLAVEMDTPLIPFAIGTAIFCAVVIMLSTVGSHVIYGLRSQVKEAMQLGQYTIDEKIGEGGMGTVYKARHAMLRRPTAIKLLRPERTGTASLRRFEREVQTTALLTHPNTIAIYDYGRSPEGLFYYAMEYLDGVDLETLVQRSGAQPWERVVHILRQICGALEEAHQHGLIHRDIKPGNIILCSRGGVRDVAKVLDFGLVKEIARDDKLTRTGMVPGTPAYIAPEAITDPDAVSAASDLYAVGGVGYFLLCGKTVFEANTVVEICMHHVHTDPAQVSTRTDNDVPSGVEALIMQCLAKNPRDRPPSAREMETALEHLQSAAGWTEQRAHSWWAQFEGEFESVNQPASASLNTITVDIATRTDVDPA